jgi:predicted nucleic acid-binding protein
VSNVVVLDSGPLGMIAHPRPNRNITEWLNHLLAGGATVIVAEVVDYEVRRNFLLHGLTESVARLDRLKQSLSYLPINTDVMLQAAELWADARRQHQPTADLKELDVDVILAAQARQVGGIVVTDNVGHLSRFVDARRWQELAN